jgi:hypothetical protein
MAKLDTFSDNFDDNSLDTAKWNYFGTNVNEINQQLEFTTLAAGEYLGVTSDNQYDLTGSYAQIKVVDAGNQSISSYEAYPLILQIDGDNHVNFSILGGNLRAYKKVTGSSTSLESVAYNSTNHKYLRIRESSGNTYWDTSADGITWSNFHSVANPITVTALTVVIQCGTWQAEASTTTLKVDNLNVLEYPPRTSCGFMGNLAIY